MYSEHNLPGNPYVPEYFGDTEGTGAQASMAVAYEIRTLTLAMLYLSSTEIYPPLLELLRDRLGIDPEQPR